MHDLARLVKHLHLLLRVGVIGEHVDMGNYVVGQLECELADRRLPAGAQLGILRDQFVHRRGACPAGRLVGRNVYAADVREILDRLQRHDHLDRRAVGVGDNAARSVLRIAGIDLGHHQGHIGIHAEGARIVDHNGSMPGDRLCKLARCPGTGRRQGEIHPLEIVVVLQQLDGNIFSAEFVRPSRTAFRTEQQQGVDPQVAFLQNFQKFLAHSPAGAHNRNFHVDIVKK